MPQHMSPERIAWIQEALKLHESGLPYREVAERMGRTYESVQRSCNMYLQDAPDRETVIAAAVTSEPPPPRVSYRDGTYTHDRIIEIAEGEPLTPDAIVKAHNLEPGMWEVVSYTNNYWHSQVKGGTRMVMYQSKLSVRPLSKGLTWEAIDAHYAQLPPKPYVPREYEPGHLLAVVNIADLHLGKLCWHGDTGNNYDYKIARENFYSILADVSRRLYGQPVDEIIFVWANDFFNSDGPEKETTAGTPQDTDVRWQKLYNVGVDMLVNAIDTLAEIAPVKTFYTRSNHDQMTGYYALQYLHAWYRDNARNVNIDISAMPRKYVEYGVTMLGFGHGDKENATGNKDKASRLASVMPLEAPEMWGRTKYHEFQAHHLHSEQMIQEINGVIVRRISSPTLNDTYHVDAAFIGQSRKAQTFLYDKDRGLVQVINSPI